MIKVNSGVMQEAGETLRAQSRTVTAVGERTEGVRRTLALEGDTFYSEAAAVAAARDALAALAGQLDAMERLTEELLTCDMRCERELSEVRSPFPASLGEVARGGPSAGSYVSQDELRSVFDDWIGPLVGL